MIVDLNKYSKIICESNIAQRTFWLSCSCFGICINSFDTVLAELCVTARLEQNSVFYGSKTNCTVHICAIRSWHHS